MNKMGHNFALMYSVLAFIVVVVLSLFARSWENAFALSLIYLSGSSLSFMSMLLDKAKGGISYMFEFFMLFFIAIPSTVQVMEISFPWYAILDAEHACLAYGLIGLAHLSYLGGSYWQRFGRTPATVSSYSISEFDCLFYLRCCLLLVVICILMVLVASPSNFLVPRFLRPDIGFSGISQQFIFMSRSLSLLVALILLCIIRFGPPHFIGKTVSYTLVYAPLFIFINFPVALPRFVLFGILISILSMYVDFFATRTKLVAAFFSVLILLFIFPVIKQLGNGTVEFLGLISHIDMSYMYEYLLRVDFDGYMQIVSTIEYLDETDGRLRYGMNFLGVLLFFIPRLLWNDKPESSGIIVSEWLNYDYYNVSSPLQAESLLAFGILGPIIVFFMLGYFISRVELSVHKKTSQEVTNILMYSLIMGFLVIVLRGALNAVAPMFSTAFFALIIIIFFRKYKIKYKRG